MLLQSNCIKSALNTAGLTLEADVGKSLLVKAIYVGVVTTAGYVTVKIDNFTVGCWLVKGKGGNELGGMYKAYKGINLMQLLVDRGLNFKLPLGEGQQLTISALDGAGHIQVIYDIYTAGDIVATMPNGTASRIFSFIQYLGETSVLAVSGDMLLDKSLTPAEFPDFPAGRVVPPRMKIKLHGITGSPVADFVSANNGFYTTYLKLIREREVLLDEDRNGISFLGDAGATGAGKYTDGQSIIGSVGEVSAADFIANRKEPLFFDTPLVFQSGEELLVYLTWVKVGTHTMPANLPAIGLILEVSKD